MLILAAPLPCRNELVCRRGVLSFALASRVAETLACRLGLCGVAELLEQLWSSKQLELYCKVFDLLKNEQEAQLQQR